MARHWISSSLGSQHKIWARQMWKSHGWNKRRLLVADVHRAQKSEEVLHIVREECNTTMALVPPDKYLQMYPGKIYDVSVRVAQLGCSFNINVNVIGCTSLV